jgi:OOP family OmpA-OmpF porin
MMKQLARFTLMFALALCLLTPVAHAGIFGGVSVGQAAVKYSDVDGTFDDEQTAYKAFVGGRFLKYVGLELSYIEFGEYTDDIGGETIDLDLRALEGAAMGIIPLGKRFEIFVKAGYFYWDAAVPGEEDETGSDFAYGIGGAFKFAKIFGIRAEYEVFEVDDADDVSMASLGLEIRF